MSYGQEKHLLSLSLRLRAEVLKIAMTFLSPVIGWPGIDKGFIKLPEWPQAGGVDLAFPSIAMNARDVQAEAY